MRTFKFNRHTDVTGKSGTGYVVEGVQFTDGRVVLRWISDTSSIVIYNNIDEAIAIHGHEGYTVLEWDDDHTRHADPV